jgi:drug/metabolite transporter (DMT)-like permease
MSGAVLAAASGIGFGVFQSVNRRAVAEMAVEVATFLQLLTAFAVLVAVAGAAGDLDRLRTAPVGSLAWLAGGGLVHFFVGWTLLNASQKRIGAARTSPLIAATPMFGVAVAFVTLGEAPSAPAWAGIALISLGAYAVGFGRLARAGAGGWRNPLFGLGTACAWSVSPVLIRKGLEGFDSPLVGLTVGLFVSVLAYAAALVVARRPLLPRRGRVEAGTLSLKVIAGLFVALSTWGRWAALDLTTIGVVLALGLMSVPVVLVLSPLVMGRSVERVTGLIWVGGALVVAGSMLLVVRAH